MQSSTNSGVNSLKINLKFSRTKLLKRSNKTTKINPEIKVTTKNIEHADKLLKKLLSIHNLGSSLSIVIYLNSEIKFICQNIYI
jgi:CRISPR/Cas system-associated protein Cas5 (RAMP superfamily)